MGNVIAPFAVLARLLRPTYGAHVTPFGYLRELSAELRRRSTRVRPYVAGAHTSEVPAPRRPADDRPRTTLSAAVRVVDPHQALEPAAMVRPYYLAHERREERRSANANRPTAASFRDTATVLKGAA